MFVGKFFAHDIFNNSVILRVGEIRFALKKSSSEKGILGWALFLAAMGRDKSKIFNFQGRWLIVFLRLSSFVSISKNVLFKDVDLIQNRMASDALTGRTNSVRPGINVFILDLQF